MKNKCCLPILLGFLLSVSSASFAANSSIGVVDVNDVLKNYPKVAQLEKKLKDKFAPQQQELTQDGKAFQADLDKFNKDSAIMKDADKKAATDKLQKKQEAIQAKQEKFQQQFLSARDESMQILLNDVQEATAKIAKKHGLSVVLRKEAVIYNNDDVDLTKEVSTFLNANK